MSLFHTISNFIIFYDVDSHQNTSPFKQMPDDVVHILGKCAAEIEQHIHHMDQTMHQMMVSAQNPHLLQLHNLLDMVVNARVTRDNASAILLIRKV